MWDTYRYQKLLPMFDEQRTKLQWRESQPLNRRWWTRRPPTGVYVVWAYNPNTQRKRAIYVGQGQVRIRLNQHRKTKCDREDEYTDLQVAWAPAPKNRCGGIERWLANILRPVEGSRWSRDCPIEVNLPSD